MPQADSQPKKGSPARRRTVRIIKPRTTPWAAISLLAAAVAAMSSLAVWRLWQTEEPQPYRRKLTDVELEWKCDAGHSFRAAGQVDPRECWKCDPPALAAYPIDNYVCPRGHSYEVAVRFAQGDDGAPKVTQLRLAGRDWTPIEEGLRCPRCKNRLVRKRRDPLEGIDRRRRSPGG